MGMIVTIDGSAGSGKSTAARKLAARLEWPYLDTGAMYRAIAYAAMERDVDFTDDRALLDVARAIRLELDCGPTHTRVRVDGHDVSEVIRSMAVSNRTSTVARNQPIRNLLVDQQRTLGRCLGSFVTEGRDQGSVVFPDAELKIVLEASIEKRAERRHQEMVAEGEEVEFAEVLDNLRRRDKVDSRQWAPLLAPGSAILIDTSDMTIHDVVERLAALVLERQSQPAHSV